jgi:HEAT repeat protein
MLLRRLAQVLLALSASRCIPALAQPKPDLEALLARIAGDKVDYADLYQIESQPPDSKILPALRAAFERCKLKEDKQYTALTLIGLGDDSDRYFEFLATFATEAVEDMAPMAIRVRGQFTPEFEAWCEQNHKDPKSTAARQLYEQPTDVWILARAQDQRALKIFRRGLESPNLLIVARSIEGLGRLGDVKAVPIIAKLAQGRPFDERFLIAGTLPWFSSVDAGRLFEALMPEQTHRDFLRRQVQMQQAMELRAAASRAGRAAPK